MIYDWLCQEAHAISSSALPVPMPKEMWEETLEERREQWREMLGLSPLPERTPLNATITGTLDRGDYLVEKLHYEAEPGCYVTANVVRPAEIDEPLPAVIYHCGHSAQGKAAEKYQAHARYWGQHGYVCLILDTIELGEGQGDHHGTYREGRWDWYSRGYTAAGIEVWHGMRGLDYLATREDVDAERVGVTGISGGGAISWFQAAADDRIKVCAPVCQTGSIEQLVCDRCLDGPCDCAVWVNYYRWCWPQIGALIAPRPLLVCAGADDGLWRPYAYRESVHRIKQVYDEQGVPERCELIDEQVPHSYTPRSRKAILAWFNKYLKGDETPVTDDVTDYVEPEQNLLVFGGEPPPDEMHRVFEVLIPPTPAPEVTDASSWTEHQQEALGKLRALTFRNIPAHPCPHPRHVQTAGGSDTHRVVSYGYDAGDGIICRARLSFPRETDGPLSALVAANLAASRIQGGGGPNSPAVAGDVISCMVEVCGSGVTSMADDLAWYVRRSCGILGCTLPERQICDLLAALELARGLEHVAETSVFGRGPTAVHAIYAALLDDEVTEIVLEAPPESHCDPETPELLGVLRIGDLPHNLALAYPRPITFIGEMPAAYEWTKQAYEKLGQGDKVRVVENVGQWRPTGRRP